jgi:hypothetical protein
MPIGIKSYIGIDVQCRRGLAYCVLNATAEMTLSGWIAGTSIEEQARSVHALASSLSPDKDAVAIGIDAPRMPLSSSRAHYWNRATNSWRLRVEGEKGHGRHCEVVVRALGFANPQWTPLYNESPTWMKLGYALYATLKGLRHVYEVFPSASYAALNGATTPKITFDFANFRQGPKDRLDACVAALTVYEFINDRGWEAGGGDGLGSIVLPGRAPEGGSSVLLEWPGRT